MTSNLKLRQQRGGIPLGINLQGNHLSLRFNNTRSSRGGIPERRNRLGRVAILTLLAIPLVVWYSLNHIYANNHLDRRPVVETIPHIEKEHQQTSQGLDQQQEQVKEEEHIRFDTPLLLFTCRRHEYLNRTLSAIYKYHPMLGSNSHPSIFSTQHVLAGAPIIVSQDGQDTSVTAVIQYYKILFQSIHVPVFHIQHIHDDNHHQQQGINLLENPYQALSQHYAWALEQVFSGKVYPSTNGEEEDVDLHFNTVGIIEPLPKRVIILEEDIDIAIDFFSYMSATASILDQDNASTLLAVSAYNDNGKKNLVGDPYRLVRSDFFPGLGWMMHASLWKEIQPWPKAYWDDWLREPSQRKGRHVIRPEISRTFHFGTQGGASSNQYSHHLDTILLNTEDIDWNEQDLSYLRNKNGYLDQYKRDIASARPIRREEEETNDQLVARVMTLLHTDPVKIYYQTWNDFVQLAHLFDLMDNEKAGVPRTALDGIVECRPHGPGGNLLYLVPS